MNIKRLVVSALITMLIPTNIAVAEPFLGSIGNAALAVDTALVAKPSLDRFTGRRINVEVSAYNAVIGQTDSRPWETADGSDLRLPSNRNTVASNDLPFGTRLIFPTIDPGTVYVVRDRMNSRYTGKGNIDILMETVSEARQLGRRQNVEVVVLD